MSDYSSFTDRDVNYFTPILPLIRAVTRQGLFGSASRVVAIYPDAVVCGKARSLEQVHLGSLEAGDLSARLSGSVTIPLSDESKVQFNPGGRRTQLARFKISGPTAASFQVSVTETEHLLSFFKAHFGDRFTTRRNVPIHGHGLNFLILVLIVLGVVSSFAWGGGPAFLITFACIAALFIGIQIHDHIPATPTWCVKDKAKPVSRDLSSRKPFRSPVLGWTLKLLCAAYLLYSIFFREHTAQIIYDQIVARITDSEIASYWWLDGLQWTFRLLALIGLYAGHLIAQRKPAYVRAEDRRAPILYLRSFLDDRRQTLVAPGLWAVFSGVRPQDFLPFPWRYVLMANPIRIFRVLIGRCVDTSEEQLGLFMRERGPFVAIGRPGERFASPGALRMYVTNNEWQDVVDDHLADSQLVILQPASTAGIWWEVERVLQNVPLDKVLFCLVNFYRHQNDYEAFRLRAETLLEHQLPHAGGLTSTPAFIFFNSDGTSSLVSTSYKSPITWPFVGNAVDLDETLRPFLAETPEEEAAIPPMPHPPRGFSFGSNALAACVYVVIMVAAVAAWNKVKQTMSTPAGTVAANGTAIVDRESNSPDTDLAVPQSSTDRLLDQAGRLIDQKKFAEAEPLLAQALELEPQNPTAHFLHGLSLYNSDKSSEAAAEFVKSIELKYEDLALACQLCGLAFQKSGKLMEALPYFNSSVQVQPNNADYQYNRAVAFQALGTRQFKDGNAAEFALQGFDETLRLSANSANARFGRATALQRLGKYDEAIADFDLLLKDEPKNDILLFQRGVTHLNSGHYEKAAADFELAAQLDPADAAAPEMLTRVCVAQGRFEKALPYLRKLITAVPNRVEFPLLLTLLQSLAGHNQDAEADRPAAIAKLLTSDKPSLIFFAGLCSVLPPVDRKAATAAAARLQAAYEDSAAPPMVLLTIVTIRTTLGHFDAAEQQLTSIEPPSSQNLLQAFYRLCQANLAIALDDKATAVKLLGECTPWFEQNCPNSFPEGTPETIADDWPTRTLLGMVYRDVEQRIKSAVDE